VTTAVDVLVLGAGPGGYVAAIRAAQLGRHVTLIDRGLPGGTCLHQGCIPLKALLSASERYQQTRSEELAAMGIHVEAVAFDWASMQVWKQGVVDRLAEGVRRLIAGNRIENVHAMAFSSMPRKCELRASMARSALSSKTVLLLLEQMPLLFLVYPSTVSIF
jgi:pyruvate/2-oxoglutarate dehydrogenase complex dihydrolipoamide dehydrogenase (E3) component